MVLSEADSDFYRDISICYVVHESVEQPDDLPDRAGYPFTGNPSYPVLPLSYLDQHSTGDIVSRVIADTDILSDGLLLGFTQLFSGIVTIVVTLIFMFSKNVWVTLLVIVLTPFSFVVAKFISSRSYTMFRKQSETRGRQTALIEEMIGGQKVVKAFGYEKESSRRFDEINKELQNYSQKAVFYSSLTNPSTRFVNNIIYAGVALLGAFLIPGGTLTVGGLSVLLAYANQYMKPFNDISSVVTEMQNALACADRIFDLLEQKEETLDAEAHLLQLMAMLQSTMWHLVMIKKRTDRELQSGCKTGYAYCNRWSDRMR